MPNDLATNVYLLDEPWPYSAMAFSVLFQAQLFYEQQVEKM